MRITDRWLRNDTPTVSFELYPARSPKAADKLEKVIDNLAAVKPDFVSVTFGAGGSTREGSYNLLKKLKDSKGLDVIGYFAGYGLSPAEIRTVLDSYQGLGIENILVVRGDKPHDPGEFEPHPDSFNYANELMAFIRPKYDFCLGVAAYPEGHVEAESKETDLEYLKLKVDLGAEYIITNYTYDNQLFFDFRNRCQTAGISVPILPGVMPIYSIKMMHSLANLCGATINEQLQSGLDALPENDKIAVLEYGIDFAYDQCRELLMNNVPGIHIYTMDRSKTAAEIVNRLRGDGLL